MISIIYPKTLLTLILCLFAFLITTAQVTIILDAVPAHTPVNDPIYIVGSFNDWTTEDENFKLIKSDSDQTYSIELPAGSGTIEFKFTRGDWDKVETDANGNFLANRSFTYGNGETLHLEIAGWEDLGGPIGGTAADNVTILSDNFYMPQLDRYRRIWVYVPPDYATSNLSYPVLYMHDGQNVFDGSQSFSGEWEVDETLNALHAQGDPGIIVVAIDNGGGDRINEYSPWENPQYGGGQGEAYVDFIVETLKPHIDATYRTLPGRAHTGILGSSLGGLISTYAAIEHQNVFSKVGALSPAYWFAPQLNNLVEDTGREFDMRFYQIMGTPEGASFVADMWEMDSTLEDAGFPDEDVLSVEHADGQHSEWYWAREFGAAYEWLFGESPTDINDPDLGPITFTLYPNPTSNELFLAFEMPKAAPLTIELVDTAGAFRSTLYFNPLAAGWQQFSWQLQEYHLSPGVYQCVIRIDGHTLHMDVVLTE